MSKTLDFFNSRLSPALAAISEEKHLRAVRDGLVTIFPLIIVGSFFLLLAQLPVPFLADKFGWGWLKAVSGWYQGHSDQLIIPYRLTMNLMALFVAFTVACRLAVALGADPLSTGVLSLAAFLLTQTPIKYDDKHWALPLKSLGGEGLFAAILLALFTAQVVAWFKNKKIVIKMPEQVPPAVSNAFSALLPGAFIFTLIWILVHILGLDIVGLIQKLFSPLLNLGDTIWAVILVNLVMQIIWLGGIHGASVVLAVFLPVWLGYLDANAVALGAHTALPHVTSLPFYQWFVWIGGSGTTLALAILLLFSRSRTLKSLGKLSIIPGICNINEPIIFGMPIVLNPIMALPFILAPILSGVCAYLAISLGWVNRVCLLVPWTLPFPLGSFFATGLDYRALLLSLFNFLLAGLIYYPFFKQYEKKLLKEEFPQ